MAHHHPPVAPWPYVDVDAVPKTDHAAAAASSERVPAWPLGFAAGEDLNSGELLYADPNGKVWRWRAGKRPVGDRPPPEPGLCPAFSAGEEIRAGDALYTDPRDGKLWRWQAGKTGAELLTEANAELESAMDDLEAHLNEVRERIGAIVAVLDQTTIVAPAPDPKAT